jgi:hypothetical protein
MTLEPTLETVAAEVAEWRRVRGRLLSSKIWSSIEELSHKHKIREISDALRIPPTTLYRRFRLKEGTFCEVPMSVPIVEQSKMDLASVIEIKRADGSQLTVRFSKSVELASLFSSFLG